MGFIARCAATAASIRAALQNSVSCQVRACAELLVKTEVSAIRAAVAATTTSTGDDNHAG